MAVASRGHFHSASQGQCLVRAARLVAEIFRRRPQARDSEAPEGSGDVWRGLSPARLPAPGKRLAKSRLFYGDSRKGLLRECGAVSGHGAPLMDLQLKGRTALVNGASQGIG